MTTDQQQLELIAAFWRLPLVMIALGCLWQAVFWSRVGVRVEAREWFMLSGMVLVLWWTLGQVSR